MSRNCENGCGRVVTQNPAGGGLRKFCEVCRPPRQRRKAAGEGSGQVRQSAPDPAAPVAPAGPRVLGPMEDATAGQLAAAGRSGTLQGHLLLNLARRMDEAESPSAYATLAGQYRATIPDALPEAPPAAPDDPLDDPLDQIARRRAERRAAAGA